METLEQTRRQLESFDELESIVRTMKALAAVSIRQFEAAVRSLHDYYRTVELGLRVVLHDLPAPPPRIVRSGRHEVGLVVFGSDHGLCGRFNEDAAAVALEHWCGSSAAERPRLLVIGARVAALLEGAGVAIEEVMPVPGSAARITATVRQILFKIDEWQATASFARVDLLHNRPLPVSRYLSAHVKLLPVDLHRFRRAAHGAWPSRTLPTYTMDRERLLAALVRQFLFVSIARACAESLAAENASRLAAMQAAEKSMADRHEELLAEYRRRRQDAITAELQDVVSGYEALRSSGARR